MYLRPTFLNIDDGGSHAHRRNGGPVRVLEMLRPHIHHRRIECRRQRGPGLVVADPVLIRNPLPLRVFRECRGLTKYRGQVDACMAGKTRTYDPYQGGVALDQEKRALRLPHLLPIVPATQQAEIR